MRTSRWLLCALVVLVLGACERDPVATGTAEQQAEAEPEDDVAKQPSAELDCPEGTTPLDGPGHRDVVLGYSSTRFLCLDERNRPVGRSIEVSSDGMVTDERFYDRDGRAHGPVRGWCYDGRLARTGQYERGEKVGTWRYWGVSCDGPVREDHH
jgi:hypothetical protein